MTQQRRDSRLPPPASIAGAKVLLYTFLDDRHPSRGYVRHGQGGGAPLDAKGLAIGRYPEERSVYLFYCDEGWAVLAEYWHPRLEEAQAQAELEFEGIRATWERLATSEGGKGGAPAPDDSSEP